jgi:glycosyltransferase involved in cell wall biosynthesis
MYFKYPVVSVLKTDRVNWLDRVAFILRYKHKNLQAETKVATTFSIIIPTRDRHQEIINLLESIKHLDGLVRIKPEIIVSDNCSKDQTWLSLQRVAADYPVPMRSLQAISPGKSSALNEAIAVAKGDVLAFLDDDVEVEPPWLVALESHFGQFSHLAAQGAILLPPRDSADPEILRLIERYRTVREVDFDGTTSETHSLNGANMAMRREVFDKVGKFDVRLGPGTSGTSEDVELAQRIRQAGIKIGYVKQAVVYHHVDRSRLTEAYFQSIHRRQGASRLLFKRQSTGRIIFDLGRVSAQYGFYSIFGGERNRYRSKGRIYHYLGMLESKRKGREGK